ncbi:hypothetical protein CLHOM_33930 [Clostridium homopropionicum DSM 5847]|uniref:Uncharacterized protein n=1 Tax=Clostridium homopropionicum DSM 5847 TaxID=1121318 RepID=A0A0L6Z6A5_9CLOT|nr:hypothetical protein [Clostridium homopropionicum]KOA18491.1 hypothetical protein CLHOM_33930 [Clostridium homopropionicum DSM 5847]SFF65921.1 hypothetical protein SAMN04488501_10187 [Clostridium homopropionicum]
MKRINKEVALVEYKATNKYRLVIFIPLILGILIDNVSFISKIYTEGYMFISILFIVFWFWAGKLFAEISENKRKGFFQGNKLWLLSFVIFKLLIYLSQNRISFMAFMTFFPERFSQYYVICMTPIVSKILKLSVVATGTGRVTAAYIFMFIVFSVGFSYGLYWREKKIRLIIITALLGMVCLPVISVLAPFANYGVREGGIFVKENSKQIKSYYSDYSRIGFEVYFNFILENGKVDWQITNPKGEVIFSGCETMKNIERVRGFSIKPPNMPGKYTLTITPYEAIGKFNVNWSDTPNPLM